MENIKTTVTLFVIMFVAMLVTAIVIPQLAQVLVMLFTAGIGG